MPLANARETIKAWCNDGLRNIRFSGGEPTLYPYLPELCEMAASLCVERIAVSTNGTAKQDYYARLLDSGVNDFSVSLDTCCAAQHNAITGTDSLNQIADNISFLSARSYVTVGMVIAEQDAAEIEKAIAYARSLGVDDIRVISAAQKNVMPRVPLTVGIDGTPILRYRLNNMVRGRNMRGIGASDTRRCRLVLDDMLVAQGWHFPCVIYFREGGRPIGLVGPNMRKARETWSLAHNTHTDPICSTQCLDVCVDYNNTAARYARKGE